MPVPPAQTGPTCPHCAAPIVSDQRYCLSCGQPVAPVRLAFLDVLQSEGQAAAGARWADGEPHGGYAGEQTSLQGWLRRYSGVFALFAVLLLAIVIGLLVGHWVTEGNTPGKQVVEVKGLPTVAAAAASPTPTTGAPAATAPSTSATAQEAKEAKEAKAEESKPAAAPTKAAAPATAKKLQSTTGKAKQEELNKLGDQPIENGG